MIRSRGRPQGAESRRGGIIRREQAFEAFTARLSSQFEHVEMETALNNQEDVLFEIENVVHRADLASGRGRGRGRGRPRGRGRGRGSTVAAEQREILIPAVEEERGRGRGRGRSRGRGRRGRGRGQAVPEEA